MTSNELKDFLDFKANFYEQPKFVQDDPILIPHKFSRKEDIEISAFLVSTIAWGNRKSIIKSGENLLKLMGNQPFDFILNYTSSDLKFVHRTFNEIDLDFFFRSLQNIYLNYGGLENSFNSDSQTKDLQKNINAFRSLFFKVAHESRSNKHISNPMKGSSSKRLVMFLRWMVRSSRKGVDFGIWHSISKESLHIPLDVHTGNVARKLELIQRNQNDWKTNLELIEKLREFDSLDPAKYDFALFGLGAYEKF
jgi:uncharacterized protein (TIGR02757 family)